MVIILLIITVLIFFLLDWKRLADQKTEVIQETPKFTPHPIHTVTERYLHPGHTWAQIDASYLATVGIDEFALHLIGIPDSIDMPLKGSFVRQGEPMITLHRGRKSLTQVAPLTGTVEQINERLSSAPKSLGESQYDSGWVAKIQPANLRMELRNLMKGGTAERWQEAVRQQLFQWFTPNLGTVLQDGGTLIENISDMVSENEWMNIKHEFFPTIIHTNNTFETNKGTSQ